MKVYKRGFVRKFKVISNVILTKEEIRNVIFIIKDEEKCCDKRVLSKDIVKALQTTNSEVKSCNLEVDGKTSVIKINVD